MARLLEGIIKLNPTFLAHDCWPLLSCIERKLKHNIPIDKNDVSLAKIKEYVNSMITE